MPSYPRSTLAELGRGTGPSSTSPPRDSLLMFGVCMGGLSMFGCSWNGCRWIWCHSDHRATHSTSGSSATLPPTLLRTHGISKSTPRPSTQYNPPHRHSHPHALLLTTFFLLLLGMQSKLKDALMLDRVKRLKVVVQSVLTDPYGVKNPTNSDTSRGFEETQDNQSSSAIRSFLPHNFDPDVRYLPARG